MTQQQQQRATRKSAPLEDCRQKVDAEKLAPSSAPHEVASGAHNGPLARHWRLAATPSGARRRAIGVFLHDAIRKQSIICSLLFLADQQRDARLPSCRRRVRCALARASLERLGVGLEKCTLFHLAPRRHSAQTRASQTDFQMGAPPADLPDEVAVRSSPEQRLIRLRPPVRSFVHPFVRSLARSPVSPLARCAASRAQQLH